MGKFVGGFLVGALVGAAAVYAFVRGPTGAKVAVQIDAAPLAAANPGHPHKRAPRPGEEHALTDEDRELVWRGDAVNVSDRSVDLSAGAREPSDLAQSEIDAAFAARADALIACIVRARGNATLNDQIHMAVLVDADGNVSRARVRASRYLIDQGLYACARPLLVTLRFPATGKDHVVTVPFRID